ncbi:sensor histidine kinase, partial [Pseudonocardia pini]|uniref:sensor histidine kinase n=1 Tax=Pseudonocardia pini TaxID=2758030 RepID=UPI001C68D5C2
LRPAPAVASTVYFTVCEALANVLKHAAAGRVDVSLDREDGRLRLVVADDGSGMSTGTDPGSGLVGLRDRLAAVGGTLAVRSAPGDGTTLTASVPVP